MKDQKDKRVGFWSYWLENVKPSKDAFDLVMLGLAVASVIILGICKFGHFSNPVENFIADSQLEKWVIICAASFTTVWCLVAQPYRRYVRQQITWAEERKKLAEHHANEILALQDQNLKLKLELDANSSKLQINASLDLENHSVVFKVNAVNIGQNPVYVRSIAIFLTPIPVSFNGQELMPDTHEMNIPSKQAVTKLEPHGGMHEWQMVFRSRPDIQVNEGDVENYGVGYVELTTGKQYKFEFLLLPERAWNRLG